MKIYCPKCNCIVDTENDPATIGNEPDFAFCRNPNCLWPIHLKYDKYRQCDGASALTKETKKEIKEVSVKLHSSKEAAKGSEENKEKGGSVERHSGWTLLETEKWEWIYTDPETGIRFAGQIGGFWEGYYRIVVGEVPESINLGDHTVARKLLIRARDVWLLKRGRIPSESGVTVYLYLNAYKEKNKDADVRGYFKECGRYVNNIHLFDELQGYQNNIAAEKEGTGKLCKTPFLDSVGRDLTKLASNGRLDPVIGREEEIKKLVQVLVQKRKNNAVLVGDAGVGKTCIVEGLAQEIVGNKCPLQLKDVRIVEVSMASLTAGASLVGQFEERIKQLIEEVVSSPKIVIFIDEIHTIMSGTGNLMGAADILKPALARGDIRCIGATTIAEYRKYIEKDPAFERRFQMIWVNEPTKDEAIRILRGLTGKFE